MSESKWGGLGIIILAGLGVYVANKVLPRLGNWLSSVEPPPPPYPPLPLALPPPPLGTPADPALPAVIPSGFKLFDLDSLPKAVTLPVSLAGVVPPLLAVPPLPPDHRLAEIIDHPSVVLVCGHRGGGKTALVLRSQELMRPRATPYALGMPQGVERLLPDWYGLATDISDVPPNSVVYIPEAYRLFHSRTSHSAQGRIVANLVNISRHRRHSLIFDVQNLAHLDRNVVSEADMILVKEPGPFQGGFERPQLRDILETARAAFASINPVRKKRAVCVFAPRRGMHGLILENDLPSFWSDGLSRAFGQPGQLSTLDGSVDVPTRKGHRASNEELASLAKARRAAGYSYGEIGKMLGVSKTQAYRLVNQLPS